MDKPLAVAKWPASFYFKTCSCILACALQFLFHTNTAFAEPPIIEKLIKKVAQQENLDPALLRAVVAIESDFNAKSVSPHGAVGLMQLMPETARILGVKNIFNPEQNLRGGARYLKRMLKQFPKITHALAAYNAGPGMVTRHGGIPPLTETKRYVTKVLSYYKKSATQYQNKSLPDIKYLNGEIYLTDTDDLFTDNTSLNLKAFNKNTLRKIPEVLSIHPTNTHIRHKIQASATTQNSPSLNAQFVVALSETMSGENVPILRASY